MKFTHAVVKEGNGKPSKEQIDDAAMVKNAGQTFALIHGFKQDAKSCILVDSKIANSIEKHQKEHKFEIHKLESPETGEPAKPGDEINESVKPKLQELLESLHSHEDFQVRLVSEYLLDELGFETLEN